MFVTVDVVGDAVFSQHADGGIAAADQFTSTKFFERTDQALPMGKHAAGHAEHFVVGAGLGGVVA